MEPAIAAAQSNSDALVFFGATGDLAYKQIFPALLALILHDGFDSPIIGVAHSGWTLGKLRERAQDSIAQAAKEHGGSIDEDAFAKLSARLQYVDGDYNDAATFQLLKQALGAARRPLHYLAIPPASLPPRSKVCSRPAARTVRGWSRPVDPG
jgi:glucose-6-phosphate 1-dehydrogenase